MAQPKTDFEQNDEIGVNKVKILKINDNGIEEEDNKSELESNLEWTSPISPRYLTRFNIAMAILHLVQGIAMIAVGTVLEFNRDIYTFYYDFTVSPPVITPKVAFTFGAVGPAVGSFLLLSSIAHFLLAFPLNKSYLKNIKRHYNPIRWWEYAFSSSVMIVLIALFFTITDAWSLVALFFLNFLMNMCGWLMEKLNINWTRGGDKKVDWTPYLVGVLAGAIPWVIITGYFIGANGNPPGFVYAIYVVEFVLFNCFAWVMVFYYKGWGKFADYAFSERAYQILSLVAKTLLAWLVFAGVLQPN